MARTKQTARMLKKTQVVEDIPEQEEPIQEETAEKKVKKSKKAATPRKTTKSKKEKKESEVKKKTPKKKKKTPTATEPTETVDLEDNSVEVIASTTTTGKEFVSFYCNAGQHTYFLTLTSCLIVVHQDEAKTQDQPLDNTQEEEKKKHDASTKDLDQALEELDNALPPSLKDKLPENLPEPASQPAEPRQVPDEDDPKMV